MKNQSNGQAQDNPYNKEMYFGEANCAPLQKQEIIRKEGKNGKERRDGKDKRKNNKIKKKRGK